MEHAGKTELSGRTIAVTAERRAHQQIRYFESRGATVRWVPVLRTVDGADRADLDRSTEAVADLGIDVLVAQTGQALSWWLDTVRSDTRPKLDAALARASVLTRGPKATSTARRNAMTVAWQAPTETTSDVAAHLGNLDLRGQRVAIVLDGNDDRQITAAAETAGADVIELKVYEYALPDDPGDIIALIDDIVAGQVDVVTFTASPAIRHLRSVAQTADRDAALDDALTGRCRPAVVGPVCAATARDAGWNQLIEPATARLVPMLDAVCSALAR